MKGQRNIYEILLYIFLTSSFQVHLFIQN